MKATIKVTELTHGELVSLLSTATYGNDMIEICPAENSRPLYNMLRTFSGDIRTTCREDIWADVLLQGGSLWLIDRESDGDIYKGGVAHTIGCTTVEGWSGDYDVTFYEFNLKDLLKGFVTAQDLCQLDDVLSGQGDMWDAYNLLQRIFFGEEIYG